MAGPLALDSFAKLVLSAAWEVMLLAGPVPGVPWGTHVEALDLERLFQAGEGQGQDGAGLTARAAF